MADLLDELKSKMPEFDQGSSLTTTEMATRLSVSEATMRRRLRQLKEAGLVRVVTKRVTALNSRLMTVTAWAVQTTQPGGDSCSS